VGRVVTGYQKTAITAALLAGFVVLPLAMVGANAGANLHSRVQRLLALNVAIQSDDPGTLATLDPAADVSILEELLLPARDRSARAREMYESWRGQKGWIVYELTDLRVDRDSDGSTAVSSYALKQRQGDRRRELACVDRWRSQGGVWYLGRRREKLARAWTVAPSRVLAP
jgi:hypothetical protein